MRFDGIACAPLQEAFAAKLWFNTLVPETVTVDGVTRQHVFKYGVMSTAALVDDLRHWRTFYVSGRMQKPVS